MIDLDREEVLPLPVITEEFPRSASGRKVHTKTVRRYILNGLRNVKLEATRGPGGGLYTSREAVKRFLAAISEDLRPPTSHAKSDAQCDAALRARGLA